MADEEQLDQWQRYQRDYKAVTRITLTPDEEKQFVELLNTRLEEIRPEDNFVAVNPTIILNQYKRPMQVLRRQDPDMDLSTYEGVFKMTVQTKDRDYSFLLKRERYRQFIVN